MNKNKALTILFSVLSLAGITLYILAESNNTLHDKKIGIEKFNKKIKSLNRLKSQELRTQLIEKYKNEIKIYDQEIHNIIDFFKKKNDYLKHFFSELGVGKNQSPTPGRFKAAYIQNLKDLSEKYVRQVGALKKTDENGVSEALNTNSFLKKWGSSSPPRADILPAMKQYNIFQALLDSLRDSQVNRVISLSLHEKKSGSSSRRNNSRNTSSKKKAFYKKLAVKLICDLKVDKTGQLIQNILNNPHLLFQIESYHSERIKKDSVSNASPNENTLKNGHRVTLELSVLEFQKERLVNPKENPQP
jgi:hypothetical protein